MSQAAGSHWKPHCQVAMNVTWLQWLQWCLVFSCCFNTEVTEVLRIFEVWIVDRPFTKSETHEHQGQDDLVTGMSRVSWRVYHGVSKSISNQKWEDIKSQGNLIDWHPWILEILVIQTKTKAVSTRSSTAPSWLHKGTTWRIRQKDHGADETASFLQTQSARYVLQTEWIECNTMRHLWNFSLPIEPTGGTETVWLFDLI